MIDVCLHSDKKLRDSVKAYTDYLTTSESVNDYISMRKIYLRYLKIKNQHQNILHGSNQLVATSI